MHEQGPPVPERLDSWKAIADYLGRDVATVRRWERLHKLPVRRIAGPGRSVFAYVSEIDEWLRDRPANEITNVTADEPNLVIKIPPTSDKRSIRRGPLISAGVLVASSLLWSISLLTSEPMPVRAEMKPDAIVALGKSGSQLWRYPFSPENRLVARVHYSEPLVLSDIAPGVMSAVSYYELYDHRINSGQLLWLTPNGRLARTFAFDDSVVMGGKPYSEPWVISDFSVHESNGVRRIAVSARDNHWWPSLVTVLDAQWRRTGTFVNVGWVEQIHWLSADRLLISGFANPFDGGMVAVLDVGSLNGQSPPGDEPKYSCPSCGPAVPVRYVVFPRSEVNQASGQSLNKAVVTVEGGRVTVHTIEVNRNAEAVETLYDFSPSLDLLSASYGDRYWEMHKELEAQGKITHTRERCPHRDGPQGMKVWEPGSGWRLLNHH